MPTAGVDSVTSNVITRPNDTTAYASGDLVANSVTAGSVTPFTFASVQRSRRIGVKVRRVRLLKSGTSATNAQFRVHLYNSTTITNANGDNGAWSTNRAASYLGYADVTQLAFTDGCMGVGAPAQGLEFNINQSGTASIVGLLEARAAYTPAAQETFTIILELERN